MHNLYNSNIDCRVHQLGERENAALREVQQDRLAALAESAQPRGGRFYTRIAAYLHSKLQLRWVSSKSLMNVKSI